MRPRILMLSIWLAMLPAAPATILCAERSLEECARLVRDDPGSDEGYRCYWTLSRQGRRADAVRALEALTALDPGNPGALQYLARTESDRGKERALDLYRQAASAYARRGDSKGEGTVLFALADELRRRGRTDEGEEVLERGVQAARSTEDRTFQAEARMWQGRFLTARGDYGAALRHLNEAERDLLPGGSPEQCNKLLGTLAFTYTKLGRIREALECHRRKIALPGHSIDSYEGAHDHYAITRLSAAVDLPGGRMSHEEYLERLEKSIEIARRAGHRSLEAVIRRALGRKIRGPESVRQLTLSREIARSQGQADTERAATRSLAIALIREYPDRREEAFGLMDEVLRQARAAGDPSEIATTLLNRAELLSLAGDRDGWKQASLEAIGTVEILLDRQPERGVRARILQRWAHAYLRLSGRLFAGLPDSEDRRTDVDLGFRTMERMRGRAWIEELGMAGIDPAKAVEIPEELRREELLGEITSIQRHLADPALDDADRTESLAELDRLEREEAILRDLLARDSGVSTPVVDRPAPWLQQVQERLARDQAILSFQLSNRPDPPLRQIDNGGSWLLLVTSGDAVPISLEDKAILERRIRVFLGLIRRGDGKEIESAGVLFRDLLREALSRAGPGVRRLVIVPDGVMHRLPFAVLRPDPEGKYLGETHEIVQVPSVSMWLDRESRERPSPVEDRPAAALALADPDLLGAREASDIRAADPWVEGLRLGPLPRAREEAGEMVRRVGGASRMLAGSEATERFLKEADLRGYDILHLATHAVVDYDQPERSAILLGPGSEQEDGFLQAREITELDLQGKVVILSACRSASGTVMPGEGLLGLGRAFFRAGSRAVIGNLWPMRDADAEVFGRDFARHLASGATLAGALRASREDRVAAGAPAAAWAGVVLVGDGDYAPVQRRGAGTRLYPLWVTVIVAIFILAGTVAYLRRRPGATADRNR